MKKDAEFLHKLVNVAQGTEKADLVLKDARYLNVFMKRWETADIAIKDGYIAGIGEYEGHEEVSMAGKYVVPGLIDGHIHLESAMLSPSEFAKAVVKHGTTAVVSDPHEIANVMGERWLDFYEQATENLPLDIFMMVPSCVPATPVDESVTVLNADQVGEFLRSKRVLGLGEMMNYPGVVSGDEQVLTKLSGAQNLNKPIDGHAPGLTGRALQAYVACGITTDHECTCMDEAIEKMSLGQWILVREGTAAHNLEALVGLIEPPYCEHIVFATDDKHPGDIEKLGHINYIVKKAVCLGADPVLCLIAATYNAAKAYDLKDFGAIAPGYLANVAVLDDLKDFSVARTLNRGVWVYEGGAVLCPKTFVDKDLYFAATHSFHMPDVTKESFATKGDTAVIRLIPEQIVTANGGRAAGIDLNKDLLKIACIERHHDTGHIGVGFISGFGLKQGAIASSIGHDSHNVVVVGCDEESMAIAVNAIKEMQGGLVIAKEGQVAMTLRLELCGLMTQDDSKTVDERLEAMKTLAYQMGVSQGVDPFMTLSFMSLPVIPSMRVLTQGMFDVDQWAFV